MNLRTSHRTILVFVFSLAFGCCLRAAPIHDAAEAGDVEKVRALLVAGPALIDAKNDKGVTPLWLAAREGHLAVVKLLLENGAAVDAKDSVGATPLWLATFKGHLAVVKLLLEKGAAVDAKDSEGATPLWFATSDGNLAVVKLLLEKGANPNVEARGLTPLRIAQAERGWAGIAELLRKAGAK
jgi:ankyrin repeat protein